MNVSDLTAGIKLRFLKGNDKFWSANFLRTNIPSIDYALGGGFGKGRLSEIFGEWSSGKTILLYMALIANEKAGGDSILFEAEGAYLDEFYEILGGDPKKLTVTYVDTVEEVFDGIKGICENVVKLKYEKQLCIGWDSIAETGTKHLQEAGMEKRDMSKAYWMTQGCQLIATSVKMANACVIATNQTREKIGDKDSATHTPGGSGWPFGASQRLELKFEGGSKTALIMDENGETKLGKWTKGEVVKNKLGSPWGTFSLPIYTKHDHEHPVFNNRKTKIGIDLEEALFSFYKNNLVKGVKILDKAGSRYKLHEEIDIFGTRNAFLRKEWPEILEEYPALWTFPYKVIDEPTS
jgi:RecA/RadA recombinase